MTSAHATESASESGSSRSQVVSIDAGGHAQNLVGVEAVSADRLLEAGSPFGQRTGLVDDEGVDLAQVFDRCGIAVVLTTRPIEPDSS